MANVRAWDSESLAHVFPREAAGYFRHRERGTKGCLDATSRSNGGDTPVGVVGRTHGRLDRYPVRIQAGADDLSPHRVRGEFDRLRLAFGSLAQQVRMERRALRFERSNALFRSRS